MELRAIETGGIDLTQRQIPWAFGSTDRRCKSPQIRLFGGGIRDDAAARA